jgi:choline dehydrogenase
VRAKDIETLNERAHGIRRTWEVAKYLAGAKSIVNLNPSMVYGFWHSDPASKSNDLQFIFTPASYDEGKHGVLAKWAGYTIACWQHRPESTGYVRAKSADPFEKPAINPNYLSQERDRELIVEAMKLARRLATTQAMMPYYDGEELPGGQYQTDAELLEAAKKTGSTTYHPNGTCKMGPATDPGAVVSDELKVHGMQGLRVVDASIMPQMLSANLNACTMMIGEKGSDMILGKALLEPILVPEL